MGKGAFVKVPFPIPHPQNFGVRQLILLNFDFGLALLIKIISMVVYCYFPFPR